MCEAGDRYGRSGGFLLYMKGYKPEVTNPQHTKVEIFKGKVKNNITLNLCSRKIHFIAALYSKCNS
jgi:hypothetical protein